MTIGIIGAGHIGQAVAKRLSSAGLEASISNSRGPESLSSLVRELGPGIKAATRQEAATASSRFSPCPGRLTPMLCQTSHLGTAAS
jgi:8-hydroxy-5-deazaflavin:NADPH oxidoreductase